MFIRLTFNGNALYFNVNNIMGFKDFTDFTQIWLSDGDILKVNESPDKILKLIEEARGHGNQA
nr:MAG TPA: Flagellar and Swarming motility protein [Caudoviricetes sp.]